MKKYIALFLVTLTITGLLVFKYLSAVKEAKATFIRFYTICHVEQPDEGGVNQQTLHLPWFGAWAHINQHDADYWRECVEPEPEVCEDENALNYGKEEECVYPEPVPTPEPPVVRGLTPAGPPPAPACEKPTWAPTVTYLGQNGKTFSYKWTEVRDGLDTYWVDYGATKENLPHSIVVQGESVDITMATENTNWMRVAGYDNGCLGPFSETTN